MSKPPLPHLTGKKSYSNVAKKRMGLETPVSMQFIGWTFLVGLFVEIRQPGVPSRGVVISNLTLGIIALIASGYSFAVWCKQRKENDDDD